MLVTLDTDQFEISLLNADAPTNAISIIDNNNRKVKRDQNKYQRRRKLEIILAIHKSVIIKWKTVKNNTKNGEKN